ncbi:hypothetical protein SeLEV6574_g02243 [Synchytrium endobioticum]|uniref:Uncharacterized protein n=1 Tax=Synchytrium endobioticum TaxID=286115 RepID=A0A507D8W7_9FUNG|nr:hypothetical protein SeLEV6574_g02243 [Synchytrium endobioticum]
MLTCFIIVLVLWQQVLPATAETTDTQYRAYALSLLEYRYGMTLTEKRQLKDKLKMQYLKWKDPNDFYGNEITSITELWIQNIIPESIPFTKDHVRGPVKGKMSQSHNEFVWQGLRTLDDFAHVFVGEVYKRELASFRALATAYENRLKAQIHSHFFPYADVSNLLALSAEVSRTYLGQEHPPWVSSFTQVELIKMNWLNWCVDELKIGEKLARFAEMDKDTLRKSKEELVEALAFSQLVTGRIGLIQSALQKFNLAHPSIPVDQLVNDMDVLGKAFAYYAQKYRSLTWKHVLGTETRRYLEIIASAPLAALGLEDGSEAFSHVDFRKVKDIPDYVISLFHLLPPPENVPLEYLDLAATYHFLNRNRGQFVEGDHDQEFELFLGDACHLYPTYDGAASAARSSQSAGSTDDGIWAARLLVDAEKLRHTYATAVDARYRFYAESLREYRYGMTDDIKEKLKKELASLYPTWKLQNDPYGSGITLVTGLLIPHIIPSYIPVTETTLWEPVESKSQSHNEFVWEVLDSLFRFTYLWGYCEVEDVHRQKLDDLHVWTMKHQDQVVAQMRLALGGSHDIFYDICPDSFDIFDLNDKIARVNEALMSGAIPMVSSLTQAEFICRNTYSWCIGRGIRGIDQIDNCDEHGFHVSVSKRVNALAFSLLVVGRTLLLEWSLSAFLNQRRQLPQTDWAKYEIRRWERAVHIVQETMQEYQERARKYMEKWTDALGEDVRNYLKMDLLPIPDNVPPEYLTLAARYNEIQYLMSEEFRSMQLRGIHDEAAYAASLPGGAGPSSNPVMNERIGVNSVAAHDYGSSAGHFHGLSQDTSRTMSEHGHASSRRSIRQRPDPGSTNRLDRSG